MTMLKIKLNRDYLIPFAPIVKQDTSKGSGGLQTQQRPVIHKVFISHDEYYSREREDQTDIPNSIQSWLLNRVKTDKSLKSFGKSVPS